SPSTNVKPWRLTRSQSMPSRFKPSVLTSITRASSITCRAGRSISATIDWISAITRGEVTTIRRLPPRSIWMFSVRPLSATCTSAVSVRAGASASPKASAARPAKSHLRGARAITSFARVASPQHQRLVAAQQGDLVARDVADLELVEQPAVPYRPLALLPAHQRARIVVPDDRSHNGESHHRY